jgi:methionyl-tRNA formyltransferase
MARPRVVFLGAELNPLSIAVLAALDASGDFALTVLTSHPLRHGFVTRARRIWAEKGSGPLLQSGARMLRARAGLARRRLGWPARRASSLEEVCRERGLERVACGRINEPASRDLVTSLSPDVLLLAAFGQILKPKLLAIPRLGAVNVHPSLLPAYRGPDPYYWVLARGEAQSGVSVHLIDEGIDTGDLLAWRELAIHPGETERSLQGRCAALAAELLPTALSAFCRGELVSTPQPQQGASYFSHPPRGRSGL